VSEPASDDVWIEVEVQKTQGVINTYRGRIARSVLDAWRSGQLAGTFTLSDVYWPEGDDLVVLGDAGPFALFTGTVHIRGDAIVAVLVLKDGRERQQSVSRDRVVRLAPVTPVRPPEE
jgi:hypothetical protein